MKRFSARRLEANNPLYPYGQLPPGGEPKELKPFPEMNAGRTRRSTSSESLADTPEWRYAAEIDPELAHRASAFVDHCLLAGGDGYALLGPGPRELMRLRRSARAAKSTSPRSTFAAHTIME